jgi:hypothetical protein
MRELLASMDCSSHVEGLIPHALGDLLEMNIKHRDAEFDA